MRALLQRVTSATVSLRGAGDASGTRLGAIGPGLLAFVGVTHDDDLAGARRLADRIVHLRVFADASAAMNRSVLDVGGAVLVVSQFTLYADTSRGRRPSFVGAARPDHAEPLVTAVTEAIADAGVEVATGRFGASMAVELVNDGPVTIALEV